MVKIVSCIVWLQIKTKFGADIVQIGAIKSHNPYRHIHTAPPPKWKQCGYSRQNMELQSHTKWIKQQQPKKTRGKNHTWAERDENWTNKMQKWMLSCRKKHTHTHKHVWKGPKNRKTCFSDDNKTNEQNNNNNNTNSEKNCRKYCGIKWLNWCVSACVQCTHVPPADVYNRSNSLHQ